LLGNSTVTGATFRRSNTIQFRVNNNTATNFGGNPDILTVSGTIWNTHNNDCAGDHLSVNSDTGGNFRLVVNSSSGINTVNDGGGPSTGGGIGVQATCGGTNGKMDASVTGLKTTNNTAGVVIAISGGGSITYNIFGNKTANGSGFSSTGSLAIVVTHTGNGTSSGTINDNSITHTAGASTNAMQIVVEGNGTGTATISNNFVSGNFQRGLHAQSRFGTGVLNLTISNNTLNGTDATGLQGINIETGGSGTGSGNAICLNMFNNNVTMAGGLTAYRLISRGIANCTLQPCAFALQGFIPTGSCPSANGGLSADVTCWVTNTKMNVGTPISITATQAFVNSGGCPIP
jgi:hypothetical protein